MKPWSASTDVLLIDPEENDSEEDGMNQHAFREMRCNNLGRSRTVMQEGNCLLSPAFQLPIAQAKKTKSDAIKDDDLITTMMIRNIPFWCTKEDILGDIDMVGFQGMYDFFYLPQDRRRKSNL